MPEISVLARRLKEARLKAGLTQEGLGIQAGIDEFSASARMNQYERDKHTPDYQVVAKLAAVLHLPTAYFYADDDQCAEMLTMYASLSPEAKQTVIEFIKAQASTGVPR
jgi:transcriptional regulator with XRE-family HTH domain